MRALFTLPVALVGLSLSTVVATHAVPSHAQSEPGNRDRGGRDSDDRRERRRGWRERSGRDRDEDSERRGRSSDSSRREGGDSSRRSSRGSDSTPRDRTERNSSARPAADSSAATQISDYAKSLVKQYDTNGNMMLEENERGQLRGAAATADLNGDGTITIDELVARLSNPSAAPSSNSEKPPAAAASDEPAKPRERESYRLFRPRRSDSSAGGEKPGVSAAKSKRVLYGTSSASNASAEAKDKRRSYRFTPAAEKLPADVPGWFKSRDANGDGQVAMSEYSRSWSTRLVEEFRRYDRDDDGIITAKEAASK